MGPGAAKTILIPADAPERRTLEQALRADGWAPLPYADTDEAEAALTEALASAVILQTGRAEPRAAELIKSVRRLCPNAFVVGMGDGVSHRGADVFVRKSSTAGEIATAIRLGAVVRDAQMAERALRDQLKSVRKQLSGQASRIRELETACHTLEKTARSAHEMALRDELTGLFNRRYFVQALEREIERAQREKRSFAIALVDIDRFKRFNDSLGHPAGDHLLHQFAHVLAKSLRRMDIVARYGGEEFSMLLPQTLGEKDQPFEAAKLVERLRIAIQQDESLARLTRSEKPLTISAGVAIYPKDGKTTAKLIAEVDARLYRAKGAGRNRVCAGNA